MSVEIPAAGVVLEADVTVPPDAAAAVLFAHGSGSSRFSPRNRYVAGELQAAGFATVLADLLTPEEERTADLRFAIDVLAVRVIALTDWVTRHGPTSALPVALFGASTGAAAALIAAAARPAEVDTVVSRGGRPDLAGEFLRIVDQPTLLIVGERDTEVIALNEAAMRKVHGDCDLTIVPGATHLFEEPGALEEVAGLVVGWLRAHV
ncbi:MAG TPA: alpha/beta family hydrolase [Mycobacteriales bacterium]|nr:alpha/beta family hydrolase [Mycobacteriales bacterium]